MVIDFYFELTNKFLYFRLYYCLQLLEDFSHCSDTRTEVLQQILAHKDCAALNYDQWKKCYQKLQISLQEKKFGVASYYRDLVYKFLFPVNKY